MKLIQYPISKILYRGKEVDRGLVLRSYEYRRELSQQKSWLYSLPSHSFITTLSHKRNGVQYAPADEIKPLDVYYLFVDNTLFKLKCTTIEAGFINFICDVAMMQDFRDDKHSQLIKIRWPATCKDCKRKFKAQAIVWHNKSTKKITCLKCA